MKLKAWLEAMRLRTLPASISGVLSGTACAVYHGSFKILPFLICLLFAILAQITSNFANEYYDFRNGFDKKGREGFRRGVTEGDISPESMKKATYLCLLLSVAIGSTLIIWGGWWLIFVGLSVAIFAIGYSAGPFPLSHIGLGDIAVIIFFGFIPVIFTEYVICETLYLGSSTLFTGAAIGLLAANILIVNNYRDMEDDKEVGKKTTVVIFGRHIMSRIYYADGIVAIIFLAMASSALPFWVSAGWLAFLLIHTVIWGKMKIEKGSGLNNVLKDTSLVLLGISIYLLIIFCSVKPSSSIFIIP